MLTNKKVKDALKQPEVRRLEKLQRGKEQQERKNEQEKR